MIVLSSKGLKINGVSTQFPLPIEDLNRALGPCRRTKKPRNIIFTWDQLGILAYSEDGVLVQSLCLQLKAENFDFSPKECFKEEFLFESVPIRDYLSRHPDKLTRIYDTDSHGGFVASGVAVWFDCDFCDGEEIEAIELSAFHPENVPEIPQDKYILFEPEEDTIEFEDFGFKLCIIQELMYNQTRLEPKFDLFEFVIWFKDRKIDLEEEGYQPIPEVTEYFKRLPVPKRLALTVQEIYQDGGNDIYLQLLRFAEGYETYWDIESAADAKHFPNLKEVTLCYAKEPVLAEFQKQGIAASWL